MNKRIIILSMLCMSGIISPAQEYRNLPSVNFGLTKAHEQSELPYSRARTDMPERTAKIGGGWEMIDARTMFSLKGDIFSTDYCTKDWYDATVPGTVLTTLVRQGVYPDPYFGLNNMLIPEDLCRKDWWYRKVISLTDRQLAKEQLELLFNGINYRADIWFNGVMLGTIEGAFIRGRFDITDIAKDENVLAVHIYPPYNPGIPHEQSSVTGRGPNGGQLCLDGPTFISSEGWDWVPGVRDRNIGIWQDVELIESEGITIGDTKVVTDLPLPSTDYALISVSTVLKNAGAQQRTVTLNAVVDDCTFTKEVQIAAGSEISVDLGTRKMENPKLWMPNGYGQQNLYTLKLSASAEGQVSDNQSVSFGVREFSYELTVDSDTEKDIRICYNPTSLLQNSDIFNNRMLRPVGQEVVVPALRKGVNPDSLERIEKDATAPYLVVRCNGIRIYCKGGNWGMDDMMKNTSREHLEPYFALHKEAGFNMIRNWTGESTEEVFYQLADEYGMLVWNDFWMSTEGYNLCPSDENLFMANATDVVRRFRNHPSIAIWCPRNEGYATESIEKQLCAMLAAEDGTRYYSPNSRYCNLRTSGPWHYFTNAADYYTDRASGFNTELGSPSVPTARTMRKFMAVEDLWPISEAWHYHDLHPETKTYVETVSKMYGQAQDLDDFCKKVQLMNYDSYRAMFESWNSRLWNNTSGVLLWMTHPAWPSVEWQSYSYDYETFGSWFGSKKACEPIHVQMNLHDNRIVVLNNTLKDESNLTVNMTCRDLKGAGLASASKKIELAGANALTEAFVARLPSTDKVYILRLELKDSAGRLLSINDYILDGSGSRDFTGLNSLQEVRLKASCKRQGDMLVYRLSNPGKTLAVGVKLNLEDASTGEQILPAIFSDGYINLYPSETRTLTVKYTGDCPVKVSAEGYNVNNVVKQ